MSERYRVVHLDAPAGMRHARNRPFPAPANVKAVRLWSFPGLTSWHGRRHVGVFWPWGRGRGRRDCGTQQDLRENASNLGNAPCHCGSRLPALFAEETKQGTVPSDILRWNLLLRIHIFHLATCHARNCPLPSNGASACTFTVGAAALLDSAMMLVRMPPGYWSECSKLLQPADWKAGRGGTTNCP